ncbi:YegS/Rv2252/BmrU family lipid kinase [Mucilaginibacter gracilis]|uniref:YegS/Rv2252/BmrU family lipid kinase n=1 Tax=Mucilaginibacter gracilis TaxID=423350 RepID=A0A495J7R9_9SPHI|nr:diacylglycerol kinase family protein [Mucilaginibacter gracilis]RKR84927.1 YegS/Rv2252/BmrU family lipid kinase [Mucilaginibacter gracilis]
MHFKNIHIIINPASGKEEPILSYLNTVLIDSGIHWDVSVTTPFRQAFDIAKWLIGKTDLIVIYGGDGSIAEVGRALYGCDTPMGIIPGGTANVMSKELGIPQDAVDAVKLIAGGHTKVITIDMAMANQTPFLLRVNLGIMADMILQTNRDLKNNFGQLAYGISAIQTLVQSAPMQYKLLIDGQEFNEEGVTLTVTNAGSIGFSDFSFLPDINVTDGYLDVILMNNTDLTSLLRVAGTMLFQTESDVLKHWRCKQVTVTLNQPVSYICDDTEQQSSVISIKIMPRVLKVLVADNYHAHVR